MIVASNTDMKEQLEKLKEKWNIKNISLLPPLFDPSPFAQYQDKEDENFFANRFNIRLEQAPVVLCIASMSKNKNQQLLIKAADLLINQRNRKINLVFVGSHSKKIYFYLSQLIKKLALEKWVHFTSFCKDVPTLLANSDIKVLPSKEEAFGIVLLEAGLMKRPTIAPRKGGPKDIVIHGKTGLLFEPDNYHDLADKMELLLENPHQAKMLGDEAYQHIVDNFNPKKTFEKIENSYRRLFVSE